MSKNVAEKHSNNVEVEKNHIEPWHVISNNVAFWQV